MISTEIRPTGTHLLHHFGFITDIKDNVVTKLSEKTVIFQIQGKMNLFIPV
jgi:hypothetical protein